MRESDNNDLNPAQTSGNSPPSKYDESPWQRQLAALEADVRKMSRYIARRIPDEGVRLTLWDGNSDYPPTIADVSALWAEGEVEILVETNDPEEVDQYAVYNHFRWQEMTLAERHRHLEYFRLKHQLARLTSPPPVPQFNPDLRTLFFGGHIIKQFKQAASNQLQILTAFEEERWPLRIDDPLTGAGEQRERLNDTLRDLNRNHQTAGLLRFVGDGTGEGIIWTAIRWS